MNDKDLRELAEEIENIIEQNTTVERGRAGDEYDWVDTGVVVDEILALVEAREKRQIQIFNNRIDGYINELHKRGVTEADVIFILKKLKGALPAQARKK